MRFFPIQPHTLALLGSDLSFAAQIKVVPLCLLGMGITLVLYRHSNFTLSGRNLWQVALEGNSLSQQQNV